MLHASASCKRGEGDIICQSKGSTRRAAKDLAIAAAQERIIEKGIIAMSSITNDTDRIRAGTPAPRPGLSATDRRSPVFDELPSFGGGSIDGSVINVSPSPKSEMARLVAASAEFVEARGIAKAKAKALCSGRSSQQWQQQSAGA